MRIKILLIFLLASSYCTAQNYMAVHQLKDSLDHFVPFYDTDVTSIGVGVNLNLPQDSTYTLYYIVRKKSTLTSNALYGNEIKLVRNNFEFALPINDTFVNSGNYTIVFSLLNAKKELVETVETSFQTLRNENTFFRQAAEKNRSLLSSKITESASNVNIQKTFVSKYNLASIRANILAIAPRAEKAEQATLNDIVQGENLEDLQRFFYNFWYARNPQNPEAEWKLYAEKLNYCAKNYAYGTLKGYQTDMGQLYLRFGPPNRKVRASNERGTKPYEVWFYSELDKYTNLNILFAQIGTLGNERVLIHSNLPEFYFNPNWAQQLFTEPQEQFNKNSHRVYEFFK